MSGICSAHQHHEKGCRLCEAEGVNMKLEEKLNLKLRDFLWEKEFEEEWMVYRPDDPICYEDYEEDKDLAKMFYLAACRKRQERIERGEV